MSLQLILGNSGSGKSHLMYQKIIDTSTEHPKKNFMVIVPEQFTMQTQKELVMLHPNKGIMNIDVLSFPRLAHRIFEETGEDRRLVLTETGKNLMIRRIAMELAEELPVLGSRMNRAGYVSKVKSVLSELMQYEVTVSELSDLIDQVSDRPLLQAKLLDVRKLYAAFLEDQKDRFMKPEELLDILCRAAEHSDLLRNSTLAFDGFTGFTPSQVNVLKVLMRLCPQIYVTVTIDARESWLGAYADHELFALSKKTIRMLLDTAREEAPASEYPFEIQEPIVLGLYENPRFPQKKELYHLEQNLFRPRRQIYRRRKQAADMAADLSDRARRAEYPADFQDSEISLHESADPAGETAFAARTISRLVREEGYRYYEIAVITGNLASYENHVRKIFDLYEIPYFIDQTRHILLNPCLEFVRSALAVAQQDFSAESVIRYLRTGLAGFSEEETDRLENFLLASGIRGRKRWEEPWIWHKDGKMQEETEEYNRYRETVMQQLGAFSAQMRKKTALLREDAESLYALMASCHLQQKLKDQEQIFLNRQEPELAKEYSQIYGILLGILDEMVELLGEEQVTGREFSDILDAGFEEAKVGIIPPGIDQVQIGDIERSRLSHIKALFFLGLNDGWVPSRGEDSGIISDMERELLEKRGADLAPTGREDGYIQRFYLYQNLTKPENHLYLSWCRTGSDGTAMRPSYLVSVISRMFPELQIRDEEKIRNSLYQITAPENGMKYLTDGLRAAREGQETEEWLEVYRTYLLDDRYRLRVQELTRAAFLRGNDGHLTYTTSRELYGEVLQNSVTRLEQFAACAFAHFAAYGLRLRERELYGIRPVDLGIIFHRSMELFSRKLQAGPYEWDTIPEEIQKELIDQCVDEVTDAYGEKVFHSSARAEYTIQRIKRILGRSVWALHQQLISGSYRPKNFEVSFEALGDLEAVNVNLEHGGCMHLQGRIDRIDTCETEDCVYLKVIDYKSGMTQFDPVSLYYGLQLQLIVYLNAALEMEERVSGGKKAVPAGILYYHMQDPVLEREGDLEDEKVQEKLLKKLKPDGILNSDREILQTMDHKIGADSLVIPAALKKDGTLKAGSSAITTEQFAAVCHFVRKKLKETGERMMDGEIGVHPVKNGQQSACDFCEFSDVCGFDRKLPGMCEQKLPGISRDEAWKRIFEEGTSDGDSIQ